MRPRFPGAKPVLVAEAHVGNKLGEDAEAGESPVSLLVSRAWGEDAFGCIVGKASG